MRIHMLALSSFLTSCASPSLPSPPPVSSTQGITLVEMAKVMDVRNLPDTPANNGQDSTGSKIAGGISARQTGSSESGKTGTRLTLLSDNGEVRNYNVEPGEIFRVGEPVKIISNNGNLKITH